MIQYGYNEKFLTRDGKPWFPIMGEFHYSRYPHEYWEESLYKMKAGGVDIVSSYVFWIHHEEVENEYDFTENRDLHKFVELCGKCGLTLFLRIGPWCHGEVRNGGFPDWLLQKSFPLRANDEAYFSTVERLYTQLFKQVDGLLHKDGGPVIGVQIENEYAHCGGLLREDGENHMRRLAAIAREVGFDVPYYTATGWGGAATGDLLPVMGGYCDAPWDQRTSELPQNGNYIFTHERNDSNIGSDRRFGEGLTYDIDKFPFLTAELGGGLQVTRHRRPVPTPKDIGAMSMVKLGSGVNLLGYYMYHGGTNPVGKLSTLQESRETGYPNDLPILSYDFNAPIREYGQISETLKEIKLLAAFAKDFGEALCEMPADIPSENPLTPENLTDIRWSVRHNGASGYLFVNNHQRHHPMAAHHNRTLQVSLGNDSVTFPPVDIKDGDYFFLPINLPVPGGVMVSALATPFCKLNAGTDDETVVMYSDREPQYCFKGDVNPKSVLTISRTEALNAWKVRLDQEYLMISHNCVTIENDKLVITGREECRFKIYPKPSCDFSGFSRLADAGDFAVYQKAFNLPDTTIFAAECPSGDAGSRYQLSVDHLPVAHDWFLCIDYVGDMAELYWNNQLVADNFFTGQKWEIGLKRFGFPQKLELRIKPLHRGDRIYLEQWPEFQGESVCKLVSITLTPEFQENLPFSDVVP